MYILFTIVTFHFIFIYLCSCVFSLSLLPCLTNGLFVIHFSYNQAQFQAQFIFSTFLLFFYWCLCLIFTVSLSFSFGCVFIAPFPGLNTCICFQSFLLAGKLFQTRNFALSTHLAMFQKLWHVLFPCLSVLSIFKFSLQYSF